MLCLQMDVTLNFSLFTTTTLHKNDFRSNSRKKERVDVVWEKFVFSLKQITSTFSLSPLEISRERHIKFLTTTKRTSEAIQTQMPKNQVIKYLLLNSSSYQSFSYYNNQKKMLHTSFLMLKHFCLRHYRSYYILLPF